MKICPQCSLYATNDRAMFCRRCGVLFISPGEASASKHPVGYWIGPNSGAVGFDINKIQGPFDYLLDLMLGPLDPEPPLVIYNNSFARCGWCGWCGVLDTAPTVDMVDSQGFRARQCPSCGEIMDSKDFRY